MNTKTVSCPICNDLYPPNEIEEHANKCIFLNCTEEKQKRKRSSSPLLVFDEHNISNRQKVLATQRNSRDIEKSATVSSMEALTAGPSPLKKPKQPPDFSFKIPLAIQVRPKSLDDFFGQYHILGQGTVLRNLLEQRSIPNMILWGPPGCGKTSLAHVVQETCKANATKWKFVSLCAATSGIKEVQSVVALAKNDLKFGKRTVLFMDEIHRFNKKQQDIFLLSVEKGDIVLIGATTENPSFAINSALLSRCRVVVLEKLNADQLYGILQKAILYFDCCIVDGANACNKSDRLAIQENALKWIAEVSDGDARSALNNLELIMNYYHKIPGHVVTIKDIEDKLKRAHLLYDKTGEEHYNIISAMHKSIRGSDPNAALYWTTRMIVSGEDPKFIARRMVRAASEDIGNADPQALPLAIATMQGCQLIGMPEADVLLAQCAIYLARAPKSREADTALARAKSLIKDHKGPQPVVPLHIRNAPTKLMKELGYGRLQDGAEFTFMPPEYKDIDFF
ncbi:ATPase WRNIP1-like isoform X2 [Euwallacea similis]|uniref:ATPase WRNIP1-like isoform X2 n=1 Tax=Euwallacea similis TaxID=1736056 RepID=UPI00344B7B96